MCGFVGITSAFQHPASDWLAAGSDAISHRGPDDAGEWWSTNGRVGLAHRRLSIIDPSSAGHQPMRDDQRGLTIVFNGEIYNFRDLRAELQKGGYSFRSNSDTEVLLAAYDAWGSDCLLRLNGMFALAIYDERRQRVLLARDRAGEKPIFYRLHQGELRFASELKALLTDPALPRRINPDSLDCYLAMGYVPGEQCILEGYNKLPPAHALSFDLQQGTANTWRYWQLPEFTAPAKERQVDDAGYLDELDALLEDSVSRQMIADVPLGVLLSGGVDSSLITAMAVRASTEVKTFTAGFTGFGNFDETEHARLIARHFGTEHIELNASQATPDLLPQLARQYDEPIVDSSMIPTYLVSKLVRQHCTVALGGDGGDELFGGYPHYDRLLWKKKRIGWVPRILRKAIANAAGGILPSGFKGRNWLQALGYDLKFGLPLIATLLFDAKARQDLLGGGAKDPIQSVAQKIWDSRVPKVDDLLQRATRMDFENYMAEDILVKVDRASMLNSLELRSPFLDYRIIEFAFGRVPSNMKATVGHRKILLKKLAARLLPAEFDLQRKQGFVIPLSDWLKSGSWRTYFNEVLLDEQCLFDKKTITNLFRGQDHGLNNSERLFGLMMFELWRHEYKITM